MFVAKSIFSFDKEKRVEIKNGDDGRVYVMITPKRYIGVGRGINEAINDANLRTFQTGWRVERIK